MEHRPSTSRNKAMRYAVPVAVAAVAAAGVGLVPALADSGDPDLPDITAQELITKIAESDVEQLSGTVEVSSDLGIPGLDAASDGGGLFGGHSGGPEEKGEDGEGDPAEGGTDSPADPAGKLTGLLAGDHTLRVALDGPERQRVSVVEDAAEYSLIRNEGELWAYDSASDTAFHAELPEHPEGGEEHGMGGPGSLTPQEAAEQALAAVDDSTSVTVDGTTSVAGRDAYVLAIAPKDAPDSTVDAVRIAVDAENGTPLRVTLDARGKGDPVIEAGYTKVDFGKPSAELFDFTPPKGTDVTEAEELAEKHGRGMNGLPEGLDGLPGLPGADGAEGLGEGAEVIGEGWDAVVKIEGPEGLAGGELNSREAQPLLDAFSERVSGEFGEGRLFSTTLVNALITEDGSVYVGAVTKDGLLKAAGTD
ncbi:LolA family protein [Streptomyces chumphonensis]|uniref:LolA family protein n=1 Tax=Streptomyces chumphonensis TaxID=1214925 RepID=UPI003D7253A4